MTARACPGVECCPPVIYPADTIVCTIQVGGGDLGLMPRCVCADVAYAGSVAATGGVPPYVYAVSSGSLPTGLSLNTSTGAITGTPTVSGTYTFTISATDSTLTTSTQEYVVTVLEVTTTTLPEYTVGVPYSTFLAAAGGSGTYQWEVVSGELPDGLYLVTNTGEIAGTPTGGAGSGAVVFGVVDTVCETLEEAEVPPSVALSTVSTTTTKRWLGWQAFDGTKTRYKKLEWSGYSEQYALALATMAECARAKYIYAGASEITAAGVQTSYYTKSLYVRSKDGRLSPYPILVYGDDLGNEAFLDLLGYCWSTDPDSCPTCDSATLTLAGDVATNAVTDFVSTFYRGNYLAVVTPTTYTVGPAPIAPGIYSNTGLIGWELVMSNYWANFKPLTVVLPSGFPTVTFNEELGSWVFVATYNDYVGTLSEEYTDGEATANAVVTHSTSATAKNSPRNYTSATLEDWFRSVVTVVDYTLSCTNLITGRDYTVQVSLISSGGTTSTVTVTFTASAATHTITGTVPTPAAFNSTTVKYPTIAFA